MGARAVRAFVDFGAPLAFAAPRAVLVAPALPDVRPLLDAVHAHAAAGRWAAGFVRYEAAPAFDAALVVHASSAPLAWFAVFDAPQAAPEAAAPPVAAPALHWAWSETLPRAGFDTAIAAIHAAIADGALYQLNLTTRLEGRHHAGSSAALFAALRRAQPQAYAAHLDTGADEVLSVSPELFFDWGAADAQGRRAIVTRPMKGTAARGATPAADAAAAQALRASPKERAENLMIVDLLRNDLARVAEPHSVQVPRLFYTEALPTVWQMSSEVRALTRPGTTLTDVFAALFPCGSVTGAPKVQAMRHIRAWEPAARGVYCGAIGLVRPGGAATFSVAIRTLEQRGGHWRCGIGSGITADASAAGEWAEWRHKRAFLERASQAFALLETLALTDGRLPAADAHLARLACSAAHFGHRWDATVAAAAAAALAALAARHPSGRWRVRLTLDVSGQVQAGATPLDDPPLPLRVRLAQAPVDAPADDFLRHKTTRRAHYDVHAPSAAGVFDTLLYNARDEITEFTRGNVALQIDGEWLTPALECGLLPGVARAQALAAGRLREAVIHRGDLARVQALAFVNSLRGWLPAEWERAPDGDR